MDGTPFLTSRRQLLQLFGVEMATSGVVSPDEEVVSPAPEWTPGKKKVGGAIRSANLIFIGGIGGWYPERRPEPGDVRQQSGDSLDMMQKALEEAGTSMANVLKLQVALVDPENNWEGMNEVFNSRFPEPRPVRSYFGATGFRRRGQLLQVDAIAYVE